MHRLFVAVRPPASHRAALLAIMADVFGRLLRMLHPFMPFLTEELWH